MIERWRGRLHRAENALLAVLLLALLGLSVVQIGLRLFFESGLSWAEPMSRMGVLWVALLGALGATRQRQHIMIDVFQRLAGARVRRVLWTLTQVAAAAVAALLAYFGAGLVMLEREAPVPFVLGLPSWVPMLALPLGFGLMALRFVFAAIAGPPPPEDVVPHLETRA